MLILPVEVGDAKAIAALFATDKKIWPGGIGQNWYWFWREKSTREDWVKVLDGSTLVGSAHWSTRRDGTHNLKDIVVLPARQGQGIGRLLVNHIGRPIILKTDHDSLANLFYQRLGFVKGDTLLSKNGKKLLTAYSL